MRRLLVLAATVLAAAPAAAHAAERHVSPTGSGTACTQAAPCDIQIGVESAADDDTVIVAAGDYAMTSSLIATAAGLEIRSAGAGTRPRLTGTLNPALRVDGASSEVRDLVIESDANSATTFEVNGAGTLVERLTVRSTAGTNQRACSLEASSLMRDSVCSVAGQGTAVRAFRMDGTTIDVVLRNVTAYAPNAQSTGVLSAASVGSTTNVTAVNVIARGTGAGAFADMRAVTDGSVSPDATLDVQRSNWRTDGAVTFSGTGTATFTDDGQQQNADPLFADAAAGDFRLNPGSPAADAGVAADLGTFDAAGNARVIGTGPDIGGLERLLAPTAQTSPARDVTQTSATVDGAATSGGAAFGTGTWRLEYGPTTAYGQTTAPQPLGAGTSSQLTSTALIGLAPGTTYHTRLVVTTPAGTALGNDVAFATAAAPAAPPPVVTPPLAKLKLADVLRLPSTRRCASRRLFRITVRTPKGAKLRTVAVRIGTRRTRTYRGARTKVDLRGLPKGRVRVRITVTLTDGRRLTVTRTYRTCAPRRR